MPDDDVELLEPDERGLSACHHAELQLVEGGYTRQWALRLDTALLTGEPLWVASEDYPSSYSDEGDGSVWVECSQCLKRHKVPDVWDYR